MIVTLTTNPSLDRTLALTDLRRGQVNRATTSTVEPGGKGVNVTRALVTHGTPSTAVLPIGGPSGRLLTILLAEDQTPFVPVSIDGALRVNTTVVEPDGTTTKLNETGPRLRADEADAMLAVVDEAVQPGGWLAVCGSLAPGLPSGFAGDAVARARARGVRTAVDMSGEPLRHAAARLPDLIAPNRVELAELAGRPLDTVGAVRAAADALVRSGIPLVVVSLGRDGALLVTDRLALHARANAVRPVSTVGAGDSLLAGFLHALERGDDLDQALENGVRWGAAAVRLPGTRTPRPNDIIDIAVDVSPCTDDSFALAD